MVKRKENGKYKEKNRCKKYKIRREIVLYEPDSTIVVWK